MRAKSNIIAWLGGAQWQSEWGLMIESDDPRQLTSPEGTMGGGGGGGGGGQTVLFLHGPQEHH